MLSAGLTTTAFEFSYSVNTGSGSGGSIYDADYFGVYMMMQEPFFNGHGAVTYRLDTCANDVTYFTTKFASITGTPKYLIVAGCQDDIYANTSASTIEGSLKSLWALAHAAGWTVIQTSQLSTNYGLGPCVSGNNCALITMALNGWLPAQGKTFFNTSTGQYWDSYVDTAAYQYDWADNGPIVGNTVSGGKMFAQRMNDAFSTQDSSATGPVPYFHWDGKYGVYFGGTGGGVYPPSLTFLDKTGTAYATFNGGAGGAGNVSMLAPKLTNVTGSTQCLHVNTTGQITGTGSDCGSGSGGDTITSPNGTLAVGGTPTNTTLDVKPSKRGCTGYLHSSHGLDHRSCCGFHFNQNATPGTAITYNLPAAATCNNGLPKQFCFKNSNNARCAANTGTLKIQTSASGQYIIDATGTLSASDGYVISGGAASDGACVVGVDSTHWQLYVGVGTWTTH